MQKKIGSVESSIFQTYKQKIKIFDMNIFVSPSVSLGSVIYRERVCYRKKIII